MGRNNTRVSSFQDSRISFVRDATQLRRNYAVLRKLARGKPLLAMIKGDAYGFGGGWVARALDRESGLYGYGVASILEVLKLRADYSGKKPLYLFSNSVFQDQEHTLRLGDLSSFMLGLNVKWIINNASDLREIYRWLSRSKTKNLQRLRFHIKWDTGMHRLGIPHTEMSELWKELEFLKPWIEGHATHLACADQIHHETTQKQLNRWVRLTHELRKVHPKADYHFGASSVLAQSKQYSKLAACDLYRPGLSVYGVSPSPHWGVSGILFAGSVRLRVLDVKTLLPGESVGYASLYWNRSKTPQKVAVLGAGYADGILRLSGTEKGYVSVGGKLRPLIGRISMDVSAIRGEGLKRGDEVDWMTRSTNLWHLSQALGTIPYELMTSLRGRVLESAEVFERVIQRG